MTTCTSIKERRDITPIEKLVDAIELNKASIPEHKNNTKYHVDMATRKLPPPIVFYSDMEKHAFRKNKNAQIHLNHICGHISTQRQVCFDMFQRQAHLEKKVRSKLSARAKMSADIIRRIRSTKTVNQQTAALVPEVEAPPEETEPEPVVSRPILSLKPTPRSAHGRKDTKSPKPKDSKPKPKPKRPSIKVLWMKKPCQEERRPRCDDEDPCGRSQSATLSKTTMFSTKLYGGGGWIRPGADDLADGSYSDPEDEDNGELSASQRKARSDNKRKLKDALTIERENSILLQERVNTFFV